MGSIPIAHPKKNEAILSDLIGHPIQKILKMFLKKNVKIDTLKCISLNKNCSRGVAQLVAHSLWERGVVSSSLAAPTIIFFQKISLIFRIFMKKISTLFICLAFLPSSLIHPASSENPKKFIRSLSSFGHQTSIKPPHTPKTYSARRKNGNRYLIKTQKKNLRPQAFADEKNLSNRLLNMFPDPKPIWQRFVTESGLTKSFAHQKMGTGSIKRLVHQAIENFDPLKNRSKLTLNQYREIILSHEPAIVACILNSRLTTEPL
jgi:hypothetical protein